MMQTISTVSPEKLHKFVRAVFEKAGFNAVKAERAANVLLRADLRGTDSHGSARLPGYIRLVNAGRIDPASEITIEHEAPATARVNANKGLGLVVAGEAMEIAIAKAENAGCGFVAVNNSSHFGVAVAHAEMAVAKGMIGFATTNASPLVAPAGGKQAMLGTNPLCWVIPAKKYRQLEIDMATAVVANGKLEVALRKGEQIPHGWVQSKDGLPSSDPDELGRGGTLLPLGGDMLHAGYKGFGLGSLADILSGVLSGANFGPWVPPFVSFLDVRGEEVGKGMGHFVGAMRIDAFRPAEDFYNSIDTWISAMKNCEPAPGIECVRVPGEPEWEIEQKRRQSGIPLHEKVHKALLQLREEMGIEAEI